MPLSKYLKLTIGNYQIQVTDPAELPISIDYTLEDPDNFQTKTSAQALAVDIPATKMNDIASNTFRNSGMKDLTSGNIFKGNQNFVLNENGTEIMSGYAFLKSATHNVNPIKYTYDLYGDNAVWIIDMQYSTLYDFIKQINFTISTEVIMASWAFDGTDETLPYVFAPVRYQLTMGGDTIVTDSFGNVTSVPIDNNMLPIYMKPSISKYFILYWGFKAFGYKIQSTFMDSAYFRRQVMPWTWGDFLGSDGTMLNTHLFLALSDKAYYYTGGSEKQNFVWNLNPTLTPSGGYENNPGDYTYDSSTGEMKWTYNAPDYGILDATFDIQIQRIAKLNGVHSNIFSYVQFFKNGTLESTLTVVNLGGVIALGKEDDNIVDLFFETTVVAGDYVSCKVYLSIQADKLGFASISAQILGFQVAFSTPLGGIINFQNYTGFKSYLFLDFLAGIIDEFNLSINTDSVNKVITIEPTHPYSITDDPTAITSGYFLEDFIDWNGKEDLTQLWEMDNYCDYDREVTFLYQDDGSDGILKLIENRNINTLGMGKYVFPSQFTVGTNTVQNRFFAATMQYDVIQWQTFGTGANTGVTPQMVCIIPENVSNTSSSSSANTFVPKSCYYKGNISGVGAWQFNGTIYQTFPFMFSVNYMAGGQNDPILSYSDEKISDGSGGFVIGKGLLKRFYWQRLAIMRNGQWYNCWFRLKNIDVVNCLHREYKSYAGQRWELIQISGYKPLVESSTSVLMRRWAPVSVDDFNATYPSVESILATNPIILPNQIVPTQGPSYLQDLVYAQLKCLSADIPVS